MRVYEQKKKSGGKIYYKKLQSRTNYVNTQGPSVSVTPIGQMGLKMGWFPLGNGVYLIMKKAPSDGPIWQLKKREFLLPFSNHKTY